VKILLTAASVTALLTGCSTITGGGTTQPVSVKTLTSNGEALNDAKCELTNNKGAWYVTTPGSTTVSRSNYALKVVCKKPDVDVGATSVESVVKGNMIGNVILGGAIGAIIDHSNGSAYEYPSLIEVYMGRDTQQKQKVGDEQ
jgi:hypothetical protein